jgi:hypothetical protein
VGVASESLEPIVGLRLTRSTLAVDQRIFYFGPLRSVALLDGPRKGGSALVGAYGLYVKCGWRFMRNGAVVTGSADIERYAGDATPPRWTFRDGNSIQQVKMPEIIDAEPLVRTAQVNPGSGDIVVTFEGGLSFETFSLSSSGEEWLFFVPASDSEATVFRAVD